MSNHNIKLCGEIRQILIYFGRKNSPYLEVYGAVFPHAVAYSRCDTDERNQFVTIFPASFEELLNHVIITSRNVVDTIVAEMKDFSYTYTYSYLAMLSPTDISVRYLRAS